MKCYAREKKRNLTIIMFNLWLHSISMELTLCGKSLCCKPFFPYLFGLCRILTSLVPFSFNNIPSDDVCFVKDSILGWNSLGFIFLLYLDVVAFLTATSAWAIEHLLGLILSFPRHRGDVLFSS